MKLVIAGGGTGGHLFPGVALAVAFQRQVAHAEVVFVGARRGLEMKIVPALGYELVTLPVRGVVGQGFWTGVLRSVTLLAAAARAFWIMGRVKPDLVIGVGGYASVPAVLAAAMRGIPRAILEQNVSPGKANRVLARFAQRIYQGFASRSEIFPPEKTRVTGNPLRPDVLPENKTARRPGSASLLILGGSQGARQINDLAVVAVPRLMTEFPYLKVVHQTGPSHEQFVEQAYEKAGVRVEVKPFITRMAEAYQEADLCISRAGAMAISELAAAGVPAVLIPYPAAAGGHQDANAHWLEERGGAVVIPSAEATPQRLFDEVTRLLGSPESLEEMALASAKAGVRDAAERIVREELERLGLRGHNRGGVN